MSDSKVSRVARGAASPVFETDTASPRANILLVDDQPARLLTYEAMLSGLGLNCVRAQSGVEALQKLLAHEFAVIVLDVHMPEMDGFEVARLVREHPRMERTPIIFVTGVNVSEFDRLKGYEVGGIDYIAVPVVPEILRSKVALLVELHQRRRELQRLNDELHRTRSRVDAEHAAALAKKEAHLDAVFEHPDQIGIVFQAELDADGVLQDCRFRQVNQQAERFFGRTRTQLVGERLSTIVGERSVRSIAICREVFQTQAPVRYETRYGDKDLLVTVFPGGRDLIISTSLDISERKRTEAALVQSRERLLAAKQAAGLGIHDFDVSTGKIEWDERIYEIWGVEPGTTVTYEVFIGGLHPDDIELTQRAVERALDPQGDATYAATYRVINRTTRAIRWVEATGRVMFDGGRPVRLIGTVQDITEQRQLQRALQESDRRKDEFLAMLAHELRNPVAPIRNAAEVLSRLLQNDTQASRLVQMVQRQGAHLSRILDDLLDVARITQGRIELRREVISLGACIEHAAEVVQPQIDARGHHVTISRTSQPLFIRADKVRMEQCVTNLLANAVKYTEPGGKIDVRSYAEGDEVVIEVADSGVGIDPDFLPRVFDLFAQSARSLDRSQGGLGIGLSICKQLVQMHEGRIECRSDGCGRGTTFIIRLPRHHEAIVDAPAPIDRSQAAERVLIVDDNHDAANSLSMFLELEGHDTLALYSAESALTQAEAFSPQIILLDIGLPHMDGYEVARRLRMKLPAARLIALTGYGQDEDKQRTAAAGFDAHFTKPVDMAALKRAFIAPTTN